MTSWFSGSGNPTFFSHEGLIVRSGSMSPVFNTGDLIVVRRVTAETSHQLKVGDIISFREPSNEKFMVTHRIAAIETNEQGSRSFRTKGDANQSVDLSPIPEKNIEGIFVSKISNLGYLLNSIKQRNLLLFFAVAALLAHLAVKIINDLNQPLQKEIQI